MEKTKTSLLSTIVSMMINPAQALKNSVSKIPWYFSLFVSTFAFGLFFFQTGLDLYKTGQRGFYFTIVSVLLGLAYGLIVIPLLGLIIGVILKIFNKKQTILQTILTFCLSYSGTLIYGIFGLVFSLLLGWRTSIAFGVTGVIWATGPLIFSIRKMTNGKNALSIIISTIVGVIVLFSWSLLEII